MRNIIKKILSLILPTSLRLRLRACRRNLNRYNRERSALSIIWNTRVISVNPKLSVFDDYVRQFGVIYSSYRIDKNSYYIYPYNYLIEREISRHSKCGSITVDYSKVLNYGLDDLIRELGRCQDIYFKNRELKLVSYIDSLAQRIAYQLSLSKSDRHKELAQFFPTLLYRKPNTFDEALQKILFYNALFWQIGHSHVGAGRLDLVLKEYFDADIRNNISTEEQIFNRILNFIQILGKDTTAKSLVLRGDTGQYILLGGVGQDGKNVDNRLTELFLDAFKQLRLPDPKLILRVNSQTPSIVWEKAISCIMTGIGSPLIMCEDAIMGKMVEFGYKQDDVWNVGTSACWEPLVIGKSFDQNNPFRSAVALKPLNELLLSKQQFNSFDEFYMSFKREYKKELKSVVKDLDVDCSPLFSLFFDDCITRGRDISDGGAVYAYHGAQVVSLPNTINALLNIKRLVYDEKKYTLSNCRDAIAANFCGFEDFRLILSETGKKFGTANSDVVDMTNDLIHYTGEVIQTLTCNGNPVKVGFSSPNYIEQSKTFGASLDGRKSGEPFAVHISPISAKIDIAEILDFSSLLKYSDNCINGNVVDFILPSSYIKQPKKLVGILKDACAKGLFELQLNVMDKATLIDAKAHPEKYPNLVVRVWGFSAYFNDLPEEFKDNLIRRAEIYEAA